MKTLTSFLKNLYDTTFIHMYYFQNHQLLKSYPNVEMNFPFVEVQYQKLLNQNTDISYLFTTHQHYWGLIYKKETQEAILIGPAFLEQPSPNEIKEILYEYQMPTQDLYTLQEFFQFIPKFSFHQFCSLLVLVYRELLGQDLIFDAFLKEDKEERRQIANEHSLQITKAKEEELLHNTYQYEQQYLHYIETGNIEGLKHFLVIHFSYRLDVSQITLYGKLKIWLSLVRLLQLARQSKVGSLLKTPINSAISIFNKVKNYKILALLISYSTLCF